MSSEPLPFTKRQLEEALAHAVGALRTLSSMTGKQESRAEVARRAAYKMGEALNMGDLGWHPWHPIDRLLERLVDPR